MKFVHSVLFVTIALVGFAAEGRAETYAKDSAACSSTAKKYVNDIALCNQEQWGTNGPNVNTCVQCNLNSLLAGLTPIAIPPAVPNNPISAQPVQPRSIPPSTSNTFSQEQLQQHKGFAATAKKDGGLFGTQINQPTEKAYIASAAQRVADSAQYRYNVENDPKQNSNEALVDKARQDYWEDRDAMSTAKEFAESTNIAKKLDATNSEIQKARTEYDNMDNLNPNKASTGQRLNQLESEARVLGLEEKAAYTRFLAGAGDDNPSLSQTEKDTLNNNAVTATVEAIDARRNSTPTGDTAGNAGGSSQSPVSGSQASAPGTLQPGDVIKSSNGSDIKGDENCTVSSGLNSKYNCAEANTYVGMAQMGSQVGSIGGQLSTAVMGQTAATKAAGAKSQSASIKAAAGLAKTTGVTQVGLGTANVAGAAMIYKYAVATHGEYSKTLDKANVTVASACDPKIKGNCKYVINSDRSKTFDTPEQALAALKEARTEQTTISGKAKATVFSLLRDGVVQLATGATSLATAKQLKEAADNFKAPNMAAPRIVPEGDPLATAEAPVIRGSGQSTASAAGVEEVTDTTEDSGLGAPLGKEPPGGLGAPAPDAGEYIVQDGKGGGGGGGASGGGVSTSASNGGGETDSTPRTAANDGNLGSYAAASGAGGGGGGNGRGGKDAGVGMPDLNSMLAALLPKAEEEGQPSANILAYGNRMPASENSILGRDSKSLFTRISEVNADKFKRGSIK